MVDGLTSEDRRQRTEGRGVVAAAPRFFIAVGCLLYSVFCCAEELPDPTRIPAIIAAPVAVVGTQAAPAGLQSIIISKTRRAAIIDGETVELGGKHGDTKLIEVNEGSVMLLGAQGRQVLTLFPEVKMTSRKEPQAKVLTPVGKVQSGKKMPGSGTLKEKK
jgi:MSHA biogenesis protein MshK